MSTIPRLLLGVTSAEPVTITITGSISTNPKLQVWKEQGEPDLLEYDAGAGRWQVALTPGAYVLRLDARGDGDRDDALGRGQRTGGVRAPRRGSAGERRGDHSDVERDERGGGRVGPQPVASAGVGQRSGAVARPRGPRARRRRAEALRPGPEARVASP
jgi:hypothetical protein